MKILEQIQKVDTPPYLYLKIQQRIMKEKGNTLQMSASWGLGIAFSLLLMLNVFVIKEFYILEFYKTDLIQKLNLVSENNIYK